MFHELLPLSRFLSKHKGRAVGGGEKRCRKREKDNAKGRDGRERRGREKETEKERKSESGDRLSENTDIDTENERLT